MRIDPSHAAMTESEVNRRDFVFGAASAAVSAWLATHGAELHATAAYAASATSQQPYEFFTADEAREFDAISAQIVPTDDTPGAREAHVVRFLDHYLATVFSNGQSDFRKSLTQLSDAVAASGAGHRSFATLSDADQIALLLNFEKSNRASFNVFRGATMTGMFSDPVHGGNFRKVGWKLNGYEDRYSWTPPFGYYDRV